jgi:hypothetical protein
MAVYREELNGLAMLISALCRQPYAMSAWCSWSHITLNLFVARDAASLREIPSFLCHVTPMGQNYLVQSMIDNTQPTADRLDDAPKSLEETIHAINALADNLLNSD